VATSGPNKPGALPARELLQARRQFYVFRRRAAMKEMPTRPAMVKAAEDQDTLLRRINAREKKHRAVTLQHLYDQGGDLLALKKQCGHGNWKKKCAQGVEVGYRTVCRYMEYRLKCDESSHLTDDERWQLWQQIQGSPNYRHEDDEDNNADDGASETDGAAQALGEPVVGADQQRDLDHLDGAGREVLDSPSAAQTAERLWQRLRKAVTRLRKRLDGHLGAADKAYSGLLKLIKCLGDLDGEDRKSLIGSLENHRDRCTVMIEALHGQGVKLLPSTEQVEDHENGEVIEHGELG
jgi:hypothetical protein